MGREIKFRAYDDDYKEMLYDVGVSQGKANDLRLMKSRMIPLETTALEAIESIVYSKIHLMQFTGLKDKNGREIYEGDIVRHEDFSCGACITFPQHTRISKIEWGESGYELPGMGYTIEGKRCEVIGNIYENPELLTPDQPKEK